VHAVLQQIPSMQNELKQDTPVMHVAPSSPLHVPIPSHACVAPEHPPSSLPTATFEQVPAKPLTLQDLQSAVHDVSQQTPSTQFPLRHWLAIVHIVPLTRLQIPLPSHWFDPTHRFVGAVSMLPGGKLPHVPMLPATPQDWHAVLHALLQHTPSTQKLLKQASLAAQG
jgi:hypothetical protein